MIKRWLNRVFIQGLSGMATGLFATLIIGTIMSQAGTLLGGELGEHLIMMSSVVKALTGAGIGMKAETTRNFEAGLLTDQPEIAEQAMNLFDDVWIGKMCKTCKRRMYCADSVG